MAEAPPGLIRPGEVSVIMGRTTEPEYEALDDDELRVFDTDLAKLAGSFFRARDAFSIFLEDRDLYLYAAQIAKAQLNAGFGGAVPGGNEVGMQFIRPKTILGANHWFQSITSAGWNNIFGSAASPIDLSTTSTTYGNPQNRVLLVFPKLGDFTVPKVQEVWFHIGPTAYPIWPLPFWFQTDVWIHTLPYAVIIPKNERFYMRGNVLGAATQIATFPLGLCLCLGSYMTGSDQE